MSFHLYLQGNDVYSPYYVADLCNVYVRVLILIFCLVHELAEWELINA